MKIAYIATEKLPVPAIRGGAIQIYISSVAAIIGTKHDVTVFSIQHEELENQEKRGNVRYIRFDEKNYLSSVISQLQQEKYDVIHLCNRPLWVKAVKEATPESKIVLSVHNEMFTFEKLSDEEGKKCLNLVSKVVTVSDYIGSTITNRFPFAKSKVNTVYSGVDLDAFQPPWTSRGSNTRENIRSELGLSNRKVILFVGRLSKVKGPHILLQALPSIKKEHPNVTMVFIGSKWFGDDQVNNYVKHLYTLGAMYQENVMFIKFVKPVDIPKLFAMSEVFVCSSQWQEPLARVHYEAMAAGLPIITSKRGGNPEVINEGKNGFVVEQFEDPESYASLINSLLSDSNKRERLGRNGREKVEKEFSWNNVENNLMRVYNEANSN
ncbi:glycosyltransferase family 4 protein [Sutcliffiella rhizosphaerae]|uniref:Spore coat protein SA n=1 Tax=Sutcliffiella rhizosphaerae TaxID=2880967 RepID=A0ABN8A8Z0_9BACI|nr:glycosyltransferase family 4 protein [Sutcliffiella rhizosphaerae]CAG9620286.1 Spore coat protein SA [Sutcliffiella rhizosphaerae]